MPSPKTAIHHRLGSDVFAHALTFLGIWHRALAPVCKGVRSIISKNRALLDPDLSNKPLCSVGLARDLLRLGLVGGIRYMTKRCGLHISSTDYTWDALHSVESTRYILYEHPEPPTLTQWTLVHAISYAPLGSLEMIWHAFKACHDWTREGLGCVFQQDLYFLLCGITQARSAETMRYAYFEILGDIYRAAQGADAICDLYYLKRVEDAAKRLGASDVVAHISSCMKCQYL